MAEMTVGDVLNSMTKPERAIVYSILALAYDEPISYKYYCAFNLMSKEKQDVILYLLGEILSKEDE
jgi:hypothetical protein